MESSICTIIPFQTISGLQIIKIWSMNYALHFGRVYIRKHCLYWSVFNTERLLERAIERFFSMECYL